MLQRLFSDILCLIVGLMQMHFNALRMQLTNDFVEASSWASTVEETLRTSGTAFNFSFSIAPRGRQFFSSRCPIVLCFSVLLCAGRKPRLTERLAFIPQRPLSTSTIAIDPPTEVWLRGWRVTLLFP